MEGSGGGELWRGVAEGLCGARPAWEGARPTRPGVHVWRSRQYEPGEIPVSGFGVECCRGGREGLWEGRCEGWASPACCG